MAECVFTHVCQRAAPFLGGSALFPLVSKYSHSCLVVLE